MSEKHTGKGDFSDFFREEAAAVLGLTHIGQEPAAGAAGPTPLPEGELPRLPQARKAPEKEHKAYWRTLRVFFRSGIGGGIAGAGADRAAYPALMAPYRQRQHLRQQSPCWMADAETFARGEESGMMFRPFDELLVDAVQAFAPADHEARILKDNLERLEIIVREKLQHADAAFKYAPVLDEALAELTARLSVQGPEGDAFTQDLADLKKHLPQTGILIPFTARASLHVLANYLGSHLKGQRRRLLDDIQGLAARLRDILAVEREKSPEAKSPDQLHSAMDFADAFLNFDELSHLLPTVGADAIPEERLHRIEKILATLERAEGVLFETDAIVLIARDIWDTLDYDWAGSFPHAAVKPALEGNAAEAAVAAFDQQMAAAAQVFAAIRLARLEADNHYVPEIHGDFFDHFDWHSFTGEELAVCPPVILIIGARDLMATELNAFSRLLSSDRPVKTLVICRDAVEAYQEPAAMPSLSDIRSRQEPAALAVAHRNTYVLQAACVHLPYLYEGFREGLSAFSPALFYLFMPNSGSNKGGHTYLGARAAVEGRAFPAFSYDSRRGPRWGSRFDIRHNPQPETDWPEHLLAFCDEEGRESTLTASFTFADFAAQHALLSGQFHLVAPRYWNDDLVPLASYLTLSPEESYSKVPFIWMLDEEGWLQKAAVALPVVLACRERLDFWNFLQENAGVHSYHVEQATEKLRRELEAAAEQRIAALVAEHERAIEAAKDESTRTAMERLAATLLDIDVDPLAGLSPAPPSNVAAPPPPPPAPAEKKPAEDLGEVEAHEPDEEVLPLGEAWIETPLCTSCNECTAINSKIFKYNTEKQAYVADPKGGSFADIVRAAESCPVRIIHPGAPQNQKEPGLEELIKRAEPFN